MPVISAADKIMNPLIVLPGVESKYRRRVSGKYEIPPDFLPKPNYLFMRPIAGVYSNIFIEWTKNFVLDTELHLQGGKKFSS